MCIRDSDYYHPAYHDRKDLVQRIEQHYQRISEIMGYQIYPMEAYLNSFAFGLAHFGRDDLSIDLFNYNISLYPDRPTVYNNKGYFLQNNGNTDEAIELFEQSLNLKQDDNISKIINGIKKDKKAQSVDGVWYGKTNIDKEEQHYLFDIRRENEQYTGMIDFLSSYKFRHVMDTIIISDSHTIEFANAGVNVQFKGQLDIANQEINGMLEVDSISTKVTLSRNPQAKRTQTIQEPITYFSKEVHFYNKDSTRFAGTITIPKEGNNFPAVVLISGSGAQDRNSEILGPVSYTHLTLPTILLV